MNEQSLAVIQQHLQPMFTIQQQLDNHILENFPELKHVDLFDKRVLSLQIELGEFINELPEVFKFWSHKKNKYEAALEEYVDCLHFILSIGNEARCRIDKPIPVSGHDDVVELFLELQQIATHISHIRKMTDLPAVTKHDVVNQRYATMLGMFIRLGELIGFSWEDIEQAYHDKNDTNYERQRNGY